MPLNLASPGIVVREVDLTVGRVDPTSASIGAIVSPFAQGPVEVPTIVENEQDLLGTFGKPYGTDKHYEHWLTASSFLAYGGSLRVVRADDTSLTNGRVGSATSIKIKSLDHYEELGYDENTITDVVVAARNPGSWGNGLRLGMIDAKADQILGISTAYAVVGRGVTQAVPPNTVIAGAGTTSVLDGYFKGIITGVAIDKDEIEVKILTHVSAGGTFTDIGYQPGGVYKFSTTGNIGFNTTGGSVGFAVSVTSTKDWFDQQELTLTSSTTIKWNQIADRPGTSEYASVRGSKNDEVHIVVVDGDGAITGNSGTVLEKHLGLSKAKDAEFSLGSPQYWRKFLLNGSEYIFGGSQPADAVATGFTTSTTYTPASDNSWDQNAEGITFAARGNFNEQFSAGTDYNGKTGIGQTGALESGLDGLVTGYGLFENTEQYDVDFILMGSAGYRKEEAQALANKCIAVAEARQDAIAFVSPYRGAAINDLTGTTDYDNQKEVTIKDANTITDNVVSFYSPVTSSSYAVFDSGYKYMFDRFANTFRYVPLNGDIAGTCARNDANNFPWFSPAGTNRGAILNAVKLAYNPSKTQRDVLYSNRVNPVIFSPGAGIVLFGDKTGFAKSSAFDRINVRRLFIYLEDAISAAAKDQLFEFNDEITRTNFVNIVEPFLRDVQAKRGIFDFVVICDETNNTAAIIDNNEFVADIFIKPARSINFIGLTFVATRTGVSFEEVIGNV